MLLGGDGTVPRVHGRGRESNLQAGPRKGARHFFTRLEKLTVDAAGPSWYCPGRAGLFLGRDETSVGMSAVSSPELTPSTRDELPGLFFTPAVSGFFLVVVMPS